MKDKKILIVEDSPFMQSVIKKIMKNLHVESQMVSSGPEAIDIATEQKFDLILLDCQLPIISGYEVARELRDRERKEIIKHTNIIVACTANSMEGDREKCLDAGMDDHIIKPVSEQTISQVLNKWLS